MATALSQDSTPDLNLAFSLTEGGPGTATMKRLHLLHPELGAGSPRTALILTAIAWVPLSVMCLIQGLAFGGAKLTFFHDFAAQTRFLLAIPVLVLADIPVGARLRQVVRHFVQAGLVRSTDLPRFEKILLDTLRFRDSRFAGAVLLFLAYLITYNAISGFTLQSGSTWFNAESRQGLTLAGYWFALVAMPIFGFLMLRWVYRMLVWGTFLRKVSKLDLLLTATHPDGAGGLAFLGKGLIPFGVVLFALSAVIASAIAARVLYGGARLEDYQWSYVALFVIFLLVFTAPLLLFVPKLLLLKQGGLMQYGILGSRYTQAFQRKWIDENEPGGEPMLGTADLQSLADLGNSYQIIQKMRIVPVELSDLIAIVLPGLIPALPLVALVMPISEVIKVLLKLVA